MSIAEELLFSRVQDALFDMLCDEAVSPDLATQNPRSTIIPNLLLLGRSMICIDPIGENARVRARTRAMKSDPWCPDRLDVSGGPTACYSLLAWPDAVSRISRKMRRGSPTRWDNQARCTGTRKAKVLCALWTARPRPISGSRI